MRTIVLVKIRRAPLWLRIWSHQTRRSATRPLRSPSNFFSQHIVSLIMENSWCIDLRGCFLDLRSRISIFDLHSNTFDVELYIFLLWFYTEKTKYTQPYFFYIHIFRSCIQLFINRLQILRCTIRDVWIRRCLPYLQMRLAIVQKLWLWGSSSSFFFEKCVLISILKKSYVVKKYCTCRKNLGGPKYISSALNYSQNH